MLRKFLLLAAVGSGVLIAGVALSRPRSVANLSVGYDPDDSALECDNAHACFNVSSEKNISHIFVDVTFVSSVDPKPYEVTVNGEPVAKETLRTKGGPCSKEGKRLPRGAWFALPGGHKSAEVCVTVDNAVPAEVRVGARSADECSSDAATAASAACGEEEEAEEEADSDGDGEGEGE